MEIQGEWVLGSYYEINNYKLFHDNRLPGSTAADYITIPSLESLVSGKIYRADVIAREVERGTVHSTSPFGFSSFGGISGYEAENNKHVCDVFKYTGGPLRLFVRVGVKTEFDEVSIREVDGYSDVANNNDCALGIGVQ